MMSHIQSSVANGVLHAVFHRPERKNSLTSDMYADLCDVFDRAAQDDDVKVLLLSGAAGVFTAGNDLDDFVQNPPRDINSPVFRFVTRLAAFPKPVVAAVEGLAIGIGTTMLLHCDLVYVAENTRFSVPFVNLGLVPEACSSLLMPRVAGHQRAAEKLLFGDIFTAAEAFELGFINRLLPPQEVLAYATGQAERLAQLPGGSVRGTKALMKGRAEGSDLDELAERIRQEVDLFCQRVTGPATLEAVAAFKEKRKPDFVGKD